MKPARSSAPVASAELLRLAAWGAGLVSLGCIGVVGLGVLTLPRFDLEALIANSSGWDGQLTNVGRGVSLFGLLVCLALFRRDRDDPRRTGLIACALLNVGTFLVLNNPVSLPRFQFLGFVLAVGTVLISTFRRDVKTVFAAASPVFLFFLFPAIKVIGHGEGFAFGSAFTRNVSTYLLSEDFDTFKQGMDTVRYLDNHAARGGDNFLGAFLFWVPRSMWAGKPIHSGEVVSRALGYPFNNVANSLPTEGFISWGIAGTVAVMFIFGLLVARLERRAYRSLGVAADAGTVVLYALSVGFVIIVLRGSLNAIAAMVGPGFLFYALLVGIPARRPRKAAR